MSRALTKAVSGAKAAGSELQGEIKQAGHTTCCLLPTAYCSLHTTYRLPTSYLPLTTTTIPQAGGLLSRERPPAAPQHGRQGPLVAAQATLR